MPFHFMGLFIHSLCIDWGIQHILKHVSVQTAFTARFCFKLLNRTSNSNTNWHFTPVWILHPIFYNYCSFPLRIAHRMISCLCVSIKKFKPLPPYLVSFSISPCLSFILFYFMWSQNANIYLSSWHCVNKSRSISRFISNCLFKHDVDPDSSNVTQISISITQMKITTFLSSQNCIFFKLWSQLRLI